jgi:hypothetical protein
MNADQKEITSARSFGVIREIDGEVLPVWVPILIRDDPH